MINFRVILRVYLFADLFLFFLSQSVGLFMLILLFQLFVFAWISVDLVCSIILMNDSEAKEEWDPNPYLYGFPISTPQNGDHRFLVTSEISFCDP